MWKEGSIRVNGEVFHYWMKQYDKGSEWGCCSLYGRSHLLRMAAIFLCLGGEYYEKIEEIHTDTVHGENLTLR